MASLLQVVTYLGLSSLYFKRLQLCIKTVPGMRKHFAFIPLIEGAGVFYFHAGFWAWTNSSTHKSKIPQPGLGKTKGKAEAHIFLSGCLFFFPCFWRLSFVSGRYFLFLWWQELSLSLLAVRTAWGSAVTTTCTTLIAKHPGSDD